MADLGLCLVSSFYQPLGAVEGSRVKCADLLGVAESAYTSKSNQDPESSSKMYSSIWVTEKSMCRMGVT